MSTSFHAPDALPARKQNSETNEGGKATAGLRYYQESNPDFPVIRLITWQLYLAVAVGTLHTIRMIGNYMVLLFKWKDNIIEAQIFISDSTLSYERLPKFRYC